MKRVRKIVIFIFTVFIPALTCGVQQPDLNRTSFILISYNVENLFDTIDDPATDDNDYTPDGSKEWTEEKLAQKLNNLAFVLNQIASENIVGAMVLSEVETEEVLMMLVCRLNNSSDYGIIFKNGNDHRGIDVCIVYNKSVLSLIESKFIQVEIEDEEYSGRDIIVAKFRHSDGELILSGVHFPSHYHPRGYDTAYRRQQYSEALRQEVDEIWQLETEIPVIIAGDFNDNSDDESLSDIGAHCSDLENEEPDFAAPDLINLMCLFEPDYPGSYNYRGTWSYLDQIIVSTHLLDGIGIECYHSTPFIFHAPEILNRNGERPLRTFNSANEVVGFSDHLPVIGYFQFAN